MKKVSRDEVSERKKLEELESQLARALADYSNLEKRVEREKEEISKKVVKELIVKFLPVYDMLLAAQKHIKDTGITITLNSFEEVLSSEGVELIKPKVGDNFDESLCEAVEVLGVTDKSKFGKIADVILPGFKFNSGPVIRYCKVKVFKEKD